MWWYFRKLCETDQKYRYAYGFESRETTGEFEYDKATGQVVILTRARNHGDSHFDDRQLSFAAQHLVKTHGAPDKRMIAYG